MTPAPPLETTAVVIERQIFDDNIDAMQSLAREHGLRLRPHIKTHKSLAVARRQMAAGASGVAAAKVDEALVFIRDGIPSVTLARPQMIASKMDRLMAAAQSHACPVANLARRLLVLHGDAVEEWPVDARGRTR